jgi:hypothetical protein
VAAQYSSTEANSGHHRATPLGPLGSRSRVAGAAMCDERGTIASARHLKVPAGGPR